MFLFLVFFCGGPQFDVRLNIVSIFSSGGHFVWRNRAVWAMIGRQSYEENVRGKTIWLSLCIKMSLYMNALVLLNVFNELMK